MRTNGGQREAYVYAEWFARGQTNQRARQQPSCRCRLLRARQRDGGWLRREGRRAAESILRREKAAAHAQRKPAVLGRVSGMMHAAGDTILGNEFHAQLSQNVAPPSPPHAPLAAVSQQQRDFPLLFPASVGQQQQVRTTSPGNSLSPDGAPQHTHTSLERAHPSFWLVRPVQGAAAAAAGHQDSPLLFPASPATAAGEQQDMTTEQSVGQQQQVRTTSPGNSLSPDGAPQHTHTSLERAQGAEAI